MGNTTIMCTSVAIGLLAWATIRRLNWARQAGQGFAATFTFLAAIHLFRPIGLIALLPQHLDPAPFGFTHSYLLQGAWGDAAAAVLAAVAIWAVLGTWRGAMACRPSSSPRAPWCACSARHRGGCSGPSTRWRSVAP
jgi:hypothetical protein